jgi:hypothetical protein
MSDSAIDRVDGMARILDVDGISEVAAATARIPAASMLQ